MDERTRKELTEFLAWCTPSVAWEALTALTAAAMAGGRIDSNELIAKTRELCGLKS